MMGFLFPEFPNRLLKFLCSSQAETLKTPQPDLGWLDPCDEHRDEGGNGCILSAPESEDKQSDQSD
jgi:hypothetical protein